MHSYTANSDASSIDERPAPPLPSPSPPPQSAFHSLTVTVHPQAAVGAPYDAKLEYSGETDFYAAATEFASVHGLGTSAVEPLVREMMDSSGWASTFATLHLSGSDLRAAERTFQLMRQVAGRAGRSARKGLGARNVRGMP